MKSSTMLTWANKWINGFLFYVLPPFPKMNGPLWFIKFQYHIIANLSIGSKKISNLYGFEKELII